MLDRWRIHLILATIYVQFLTSGESLGTSAVSCVACQAVQVHVQKFGCGINCEVVEGNRGKSLLVYLIKTIINTQRFSPGKY